MNLSPDIFTFLKNLPTPDRTILYSSPIFVSSLLKLFTHYDKCIILKLIFKALNIQTLIAMKVDKNVLKMLKDLGIIWKKDRNVWMDEMFRKSLMDGLGSLECRKYLVMKRNNKCRSEDSRDMSNVSNSDCNGNKNGINNANNNSNSRENKNSSIFNANDIITKNTSNSINGHSDCNGNNHGINNANNNGKSSENKNSSIFNADDFITKNIYNDANVNNQLIPIKNPTVNNTNTNDNHIAINSSNKCINTNTNIISTENGVKRDSFTTGVEISVSNKRYDHLLQVILDKSSRNTEIRTILIFTNIIDKYSEITNKGFDFLLKTRKEQLWILLFAMIRFLALKNEGQTVYETKLIEFLFELSKCRPFVPFETDKEFYPFINFLESLGIIDPGPVCNHFFSNLFSDVCESERYLIMESNFKIYAYTHSSFDGGILKLFCSTTYNLPGMTVYRIDEDSTTRAFNKGITANQICQFFLNRGIEVSNNVLEMIRIWEDKRERMKIYESYMLHNFMNVIDFKNVVAFCREKNFLIDVIENDRIIFVKEESYEEVKMFIAKTI